MKNMKKTLPFLTLSLVIISFGVQVSGAYSQNYRRALTEGIEHLFRMAAKKPQNFRRAYEIVGQGVAVVTTANDAYRIYVDCQQGLASDTINYLPQEQQVSLVRDMCGNFRQ